jgi:hypothetical protein
MSNFQERGKPEKLQKLVKKCVIQNKLCNIPAEMWNLVCKKLSFYQAVTFFNSCKGLDRHLKNSEILLTLLSRTILTDNYVISITNEDETLLPLEVSDDTDENNLLDYTRNRLKYFYEKFSLNVSSIEDLNSEFDPSNKNVQNKQTMDQFLTDIALNTQSWIVHIRETRSNLSSGEKYEPFNELVDNLSVFKDNTENFITASETLKNIGEQTHNLLEKIKTYFDEISRVTLEDCEKFIVLLTTLSSEISHQWYLGAGNPRLPKIHCDIFKKFKVGEFYKYVRSGMLLDTFAKRFLKFYYESSQEKAKDLPDIKTMKRFFENEIYEHDILEICNCRFYVFHDNGKLKMARNSNNMYSFLPMHAVSLFETFNIHFERDLRMLYGSKIRGLNHLGTNYILAPASSSATGVVTIAEDHNIHVFDN